MIRLFTPDDLREGTEVRPTAAQAHYLVRVMRLGAGAEVALFNGRDGEWRGRLTDAAAKSCLLTALDRTREPYPGPDLDLIVALVKRLRLETIVEKAAELGARRVRPTLTERTIADHTNLARLTAIATEAAEQTGRLDVPEILAPAPLVRLLAEWPGDRRLMFCDEAGEAAPVIATLAEAPRGPWAVLIGPEGGFSPAERERIRALPQAVAVSLGPRILRADTAAIAALSLWQAALGDWGP